MKAGDYVKVYEAIKHLESLSYGNFESLWQKLYKNRETPNALTQEESQAMDFFLRAIQDLGYVRGVLDDMNPEKGARNETTTK